MREIRSTQNQYIKTARQLRLKKGREKSGLFLLEGVRLIEEALMVNYPLEYAFVVEGLSNKLVEEVSLTCPTFSLASSLFASIAETEHPQGIVAVARQRKLNLENLLQPPGEDLLMVVDGVQDPGNLGTIIRTADAAGAGGVILTKSTVDPFNSKTVRASMGSILKCRLVVGQFPMEAADWLRNKGYQLVVGHVGADRHYYEFDYSGKVAVIVGNENSGPSAEFKTAGVLVKIPCRTESLNVSIASAILLYEKVRNSRVFS